MSRFFCDNLSPASSIKPIDPAAGEPPLPAAASASNQLSEPGAQWQEIDAYHVELDRDESNHGRRVMRIPLSAEIELFDGRGTVARGVVHRWQPRGRILVQAVCTTPRPHPRLTVAACMPKGSHADQLVAQLSQLGVDTFIPLRTTHSVVDPRETKIERLRRACVESAKQCNRPWLMNLAMPADFDAILNEPADLKLIADRSSEPAPNLTATDHALVLVGPEGGWTDAERTAAADAGFLPWSMGPHVMRIETAATAAAAIWTYHCNETSS